jgi:hypothetical protein
MTNAPSVPPPDPAVPAPDPETRPDHRDGSQSAGEPVPVSDEDPEVGLSQKGIGEAAVVRRETGI